LHARIASDGTFLLLGEYNEPKISISGKVPEAGSAQWSGSFVVGTPVTVTVDVNQGELVTFDDAGDLWGEIPLNATMTLNGSLLASETLTADASRPSSSRMQGDNWLLVFPAGTEFSVLLAGEIIDPSLNKLRTTFSYPSKDFAAAGFLTRR
jgi:hypothetical protein